MRKVALISIILLLLSGCSKNPSDLECSTWNEKLKEATYYVDFWSKASSRQKLTSEESKLAWEAQKLFVEIRRELKNLGCPIE